MSEVGQFIAQQLRDMGFPEVRIQKALKATSATSVETVMEWMISHENDEFEEQSSDASGTLSLRPGAAGTTSDDNVTPIDLTEEKPKSAEEVAEAKRRYNELIVKRRQEREEKEKQEEIEREKSRRKTGSEVVKLKEKVQHDERIQAAEERRREKLDDVIQRQKILDRIKSDREAFNRKNNAGAEVNDIVAPKAAPAAISTPPVNHDACRLAIRLPDGSNITNTFLAKEQLAAVRLFVQLNRKDQLPPGTSPSSFNLLMPPNAPFTEEDMDRPLIDLGLCPSARLIVSQRK